MAREGYTGFAICFTARTALAVPAFVLLLGAGPICRTIYSGDELEIAFSRRGLALSEMKPRVLERGTDGPWVDIYRVKGLPDTMVAVFSSQRLMNSVLDRATRYVEGDGVLMDHEQHLQGPRQKSIAGHDLRLRDLPAYAKAYAKSREKMELPESEHEQELLKAEDAFWEKILREKAEKRPNTVLIAVSGGSDGWETLTHEMAHARYFHSAQWRSAARRYWREEVSFSDKKRIKKYLNKEYDTSDDELMANEFQAYILQEGSEDHFGKQVVERHLALLKAALGLALAE